MSSPMSSGIPLLNWFMSFTIPLFYFIVICLHVAQIMMGVFVLLGVAAIQITRIRKEFHFP